MDVRGGESDTILDARRQMQPTDMTWERREMYSVIGLHQKKTAPPPQKKKHDCPLPFSVY